MVSFDVAGTGTKSGPAEAKSKRKQWSPPRVIMSEARHTEIGAAHTTQSTAYPTGS